MAQDWVQLAIRDLCTSAGEVATSLDQLQQDLSALRVKVPRDQVQAHSDIEHWKENFHEWALWLRVWVDKINNGPLDSNEHAMKQVQRHLKVLRDREKLIKGPLRDRLHYGRFASERKRELARTELQKLLRQIRETLRYFQTLTPTIIGAPREESPDTILFKHLTADLEGIAKGERSRTLLGTIDVLWDRIDYHPDLGKHLGNSIDPGDGIFYRQNEDFDRAKSVLASFVKACKASWAPGDWPWGLDSLPECAKICVVLKHLGFEKVLDEFLRRGWTDANLPFTEGQLDEISQASDVSVFSSNFIAEQYRAVPRTWPPGIDLNMIDLHDREPLPFKLLQQYGKGDFEVVTKVMDVFTQENFALKSPVNDDDQVRNHFWSEIQRLHKLRQHKHVAKLVKYFRRRGRIYILVHNGDESLDSLLQRYHRNDWDPGLKIFVRKQMEDVLPKIFGCLSRGLQDVHANQIRHKNIKPRNILRQHVESTQSHDFFWIGMGPRTAFPHLERGEYVSYEHSLWQTRYFAPEIRESSDSGGESADIFSLGLVFLEILSVMVGESYPAPRPPLPGTFQACTPFQRHISGLTDWANRNIADLKSSTDRTPLAYLIPVFQECLHMISHEANSRHTISEVVASLADTAKPEHFFCNDCLCSLKEEHVDIARVASHTVDQTMMADDGTPALADEVTVVIGKPVFPEVDTEVSSSRTDESYSDRMDASSHTSVSSGNKRNAISPLGDTVGDAVLPPRVSDPDHGKDEDDIISVISDDVDIGSQISSSKSHERVLTERLIADLLSENSELAPLFEEALEKVKKERFTENFRRLLKNFYVIHARTVSTNLEYVTIGLLRSRHGRKRIAKDIADKVQPESEEQKEEFSRRKEQIQFQAVDLENWIARNEAFPRDAEQARAQEVERFEDGNDMGDRPDTDSDESSDHSDESSDHSDESSDQEPSVPPLLPNIHEMEKFLTSGEAFQELVSEFRIFLLGSSTASVVRTLLPIPRHQISFSKDQDDSISNRIKSFLEDLSGSEWDWWPMSPRTRPLKAGQVRVWWTCHCGTRLHEDVPAGHEEGIRAILRNMKQKQPRRKVCTGQTESTKHSSTVVPLTAPMESASADIGMQPLPSSDIPTRSQASQAGVGPSLNAGQTGVKASQAADPGSSGMQTTKILIKPPLNHAFVLFAVHGSRITPELEQLGSAVQTNDRTFYDELRRTYRRKRGLLRYYFSFWQFSHCDFVKFEKFHPGEVVIRKSELPSGMDYEYTPRPPEENPPIHPHEFLCAFSYCFTPCWLSWLRLHSCYKASIGDAAIKSIPKKRSEFPLMDTTRQFGWGLYAQHVISCRHIVLHQALIVAGTFAFWVWWNVHHPDDLQNASVPLMAAVILLTMFMSSSGILSNRVV